MRVKQGLTFCVGYGIVKRTTEKAINATLISRRLDTARDSAAGAAEPKGGVAHLLLKAGGVSVARGAGRESHRPCGSARVVGGQMRDTKDGFISLSAACPPTTRGFQRGGWVAAWDAMLYVRHCPSAMAFLLLERRKPATERR